MDVHIDDLEHGGVDLNRNFGFNYGVGFMDKSEIESGKKKLDMFAGLKAFSEAES